MAFNVALSGLNAAQTDLDVKGNNIANANTTGFKRSRAEFGDLYSSGLLNLGSTDTGEGVRVQNTRQLFQQGNVTATSNGLDMAINGEGFFVLENGGERQFSRAGEFGVDQNGFITNNQGARVQGFQPDGDGNVGDVRGDLEVNTQNLAPKRTTGVDANLNLDSRESVLEERFSTFTSQGTLAGTVGGNTEFPEQFWNIERPDGPNTTGLRTQAGSAATVAQTLSSEDGITVDASNEAVISSLTTSGDADKLVVNGKDYNLADLNLQELADKMIADPPTGVSDVEYDSGNNNLRLADSDGNNIKLRLESDPGGIAAPAPELEVSGAQDTSSTTLAAGDELTALGELNFRVDDRQNSEIQIESYDTAALNNLNTTILDGSEAKSFEQRNAFDPNDPNTYNHSTSTTIFDSLGNSHELTQYFVKESSAGASNPQNRWSAYVQIDGEDVGPPDTQGNPTRAQYDLRFNSNGSLNESLSDEVLIDNWQPKDADGDRNGAEGPNPGGDAPLPQPPQSSNFVIDYGNSTQVGAEFSINDLQQNGFATGRLSGLDVTDEGVIQARFSNGESEALGQVALANFRNNEGLAPVGDTAWVETFESGDAVISRANTGPLGSIQASSVEESNVDLSEQLVGLITAQRNFQANSKTIETSDQITQTIINLR